MEFGRLEPAVLRKTDFRLPAEPSWNAGILAGSPSATITWLGNAKWGRKEWVGKLYPPKTPQRRYLAEYTRFYNSIELNATHHKLYGAAGISEWASVPGEKPFLFCPKMYQGVTHRGKLSGKAFLTGEFLRGVAAFKEHLGPVFIQFPETFGPGRVDELFQWLRQLPATCRYFLEVRHPAWFSDGIVWQSLLSGLKALQMGIVITDTAGRRDCCHMHLTIPLSFIRFVGNSLDPSDYKRCDAWVERIARWQAAGLKELYFFMHMHDETYSPELSEYLAKKLNKVLKLPVQVPDVKPELASKPGKPRGINERFSAGLEAAVAKREGRGRDIAGGRPKKGGETVGGRRKAVGGKTPAGKDKTTKKKTASKKTTPQKTGKK